MSRCPSATIEDLYDAAWQRRIDDAAVEIDWGDDTPAHVKDTGLIALRAYLAELAPTVRPASVQREFTFALAPELEWTLTGRLDLEDADGDVIDIKVKKRHVAQADADSDPQPSLYLLERALAGRPARALPLPLGQPERQAGQDQDRGHAAHTRAAAVLPRAHPDHRARDRRPEPPVRARRAVAAGRPDALGLRTAVLRRLGGLSRRRRIGDRRRPRSSRRRAHLRARIPSRATAIPAPLGGLPRVVRGGRQPISRRTCTVPTGVRRSAYASRVGSLTTNWPRRPQVELRTRTLARVYDAIVVHLARPVERHAHLRPAAHVLAPDRSRRRGVLAPALPTHLVQAHEALCVVAPVLLAEGARPRHAPRHRIVGVAVVRAAHDSGLRRRVSHPPADCNLAGGRHAVGVLDLVARLCDDHERSVALVCLDPQAGILVKISLREHPGPVRSLPLDRERDLDVVVPLVDNGELRALALNKMAGQVLDRERVGTASSVQAGNGSCAAATAGAARPNTAVASATAARRKVSLTLHPSATIGAALSPRVALNRLGIRRSVRGQRDTSHTPGRPPSARIPQPTHTPGGLRMEPIPRLAAGDGAPRATAAAAHADRA